MDERGYLRSATGARNAGSTITTACTFSYYGLQCNALPHQACGTPYRIVRDRHNAIDDLCAMCWWSTTETWA